jgi:hypothetical protein
MKLAPLQIGPFVAQGIPVGIIDVDIDISRFFSNNFSVRYALKRI